MTAARDPALEGWLETQWGASARAMLASVSPVGLVKHRPGFGQVVRPVAGAIVASPVLADWDPDPDYFFHWFRDSAIVVDALRLLHADGRAGVPALRHLRDFTRFSLGLHRLDGRAAAALPGRRARVAPEFLQYLRDDDELARVHGEAVDAETRVNPDGTLDLSRWTRPQHDGPPLRALALLRWIEALATAPEAPAADDALHADLAALVRSDLGFTLRHWRLPSNDIWEEESGHHYYTLRVSAAALAAGAAWLDAQGDASAARHCRDEAQAVLRRLDDFRADDASAAPGWYRSRLRDDGAASPKALDIAVILSAIHAFDPRAAAPHGVADPCMQATLARLEALFDAAYPINHGRAAGRGPAMGRYAGDVYHSGGAYYFSTLGAAEFCFRAAQTAGDGVAAAGWFARGDATLATVRAFTPPDGALAEQFDQRSGAQTSAKQLAWSHAAFISCVAARRSAAATGVRPSR